MLAHNLPEGDAIGFPRMGFPTMLTDTRLETECYVDVQHRKVNWFRQAAGAINRPGSSENCELLRGCYNPKIGLDWQKALFYARYAIQTLVLMIPFRLDRGISDTVRSTLTCTSGYSDKERRGFFFLSQPISRLIGFLEVGKVGVTTSLRVNNNKSWKL